MGYALAQRRDQTAVHRPLEDRIGSAVVQIRSNRNGAGPVSSDLIRELLAYLQPFRESEISTALKRLHANGLRLPTVVEEKSGTLVVRPQELAKMLRAVLAEQPASEAAKVMGAPSGQRSSRTVTLSADQELLLQQAAATANRQVDEALRGAVDEADDWQRCVRLMNAQASIPKGPFVVDLSEDDYLYHG